MRAKVFVKFWTSITPLVLACFIGVVSCTSEDPKNEELRSETSDKTSKSEAKDAINILAFGDSLTAGHRLAAKDSYPSQLEGILSKEGYKIKITNAGVSGETSEQGLRRVDWVLKQGPYDLIILCLGANDGLRQLPVKNMEENLSQIIDRFTASGAQVVLVGMQLPGNLYRNYRGDFEKVFQKLADKKKLPFYPFLLEGVAADPKFNLEDQIHPNAQGYEVIAQKLAKFLAPYLK